MQNYLDLLKEIKTNGIHCPNRTGIDTLALYGHQLKFDLGRGFPLVTTKRVFWKGVAAELLWFLAGSTNIRPLVLQGVNIWNEWAFQRCLKAAKLVMKPGSEEWNQAMSDFIQRIKTDEDFAAEWGQLGPIYGKQWRRWDDSGWDLDQLDNAIQELKRKPASRQVLVSAWNPTELDMMALPPCHVMFHLRILEGRLNLMMFQRSCDSFLGLPFNIASYALLCHLIAQCVGVQPGHLVISLADVHLYVNHLEQVDILLSRQPGL
jgi:thymidylate synthase